MMKPEIQKKMDFVANAILFLIDQTGLSIKSREFNLMVKIDLDNRRFWFSNQAYKILYNKMPEWQHFCMNLGMSHATDKWGEGAHIRFPDDEGNFPEELDVSEIIAVLLPELNLQSSNKLPPIEVAPIEPEIEVPTPQLATLKGLIEPDVTSAQEKQIKKSSVAEQPVTDTEINQ